MVVATKEKMVYYAHSKRIYDTPREKAELKFIKKKYDGTIIDPNKDLGELGSIEPYLKKVRACDVTICSEYEGHVGKGVHDEVADALDKGKEVYVLRKKKGEYYLQEVVGVEIDDIDDWKINYGKLVCQSI